MNWVSVQMNVAIIAGVVSLNISLIIALVATILTNRKVRQNFKLEFAAEGVAREMLMDRKRPYRTFRVLKYHLGGFTDDELRKILVRAGGIRLRFGDFTRGITNASALTKSTKLQQLKLIPVRHSRNCRSMMVGLKTNWIFHVTHPGPLSVCVPR